MVSDKISDLNFSVGQPPQVEINGKLTPVQPLGMQKLSPYQTEIIALTLIHGNPDAAERLARTGTADLSYSLPSRARFRVNIFQQRGVYSIVMRVIPTDIPTIKSLGLPGHLAEIAELRNGLVLVTGPTGSGKSSTQAAIIDIINEKKHYHVVTIEDPIEYLHNHKASTINQREVGHDTRDFPSALRATLRQAPKVILIGRCATSKRRKSPLKQQRPVTSCSQRCTRSMRPRPSIASSVFIRRTKSRDSHQVGPNVPLHRFAKTDSESRRQRARRGR